MNNKEKDFVYGIHPVQELLESGKEIEKIIVNRVLSSDEIKKITKEATDRSIPLYKAPLEKLNRVTRKNHQGIIAFSCPIEYASIENIVDTLFSEGKMPLILVLDGVTDVRNFGSICRSAECMGVDAIVIPTKGSAQVSSDAMRTSAGALNHIPVCRTTNLLSTIKYLNNCGVLTVACSEKSSDEIFGLELQGPLALVMGSEEFGVSSDVLKAVTHMAKIPLSGKINSLNVSVATGMMLLEVARQRNK